MKIAIIDYGAGNTKSVQNALERIGRDSLQCVSTKIEYLTTNDIKKLETADKIIFPGVGNAKFAMQNLKAKNLDTFLKNTKKPVLGICLGMQLLFDFSEEENTECLGIIYGKIIKFNNSRDADLLRLKNLDLSHLRNSSTSIKIPHMGWNNITVNNNSSTIDYKLLTNDYFYFVHSYFVPISDYTIATCQYGDQIFSAVVQKENFIGMQFHPEKSGKVGEQVIKNFLEM